MSKTLKALIHNEIDQTIDGLDGGIFVTYAGLDSEKMYALRSAFNGAGVTMKVIPNRIASQVFDKKDFTGSSIKDVLKGDTAMIYGESPIAAARAVKDRIKDGVAIEWKGAFLEQEVYGPEEAAKIADLPTREEVLSQIAFCYQGSAQRIAGVFQQTYKQIAGCFLSYQEEQEGYHLRWRRPGEVISTPVFVNYRCCCP